MNLFPFSFYRVSGHSMEPTLKNGQVVVADYLSFRFRPPQVGDIILFDFGSKKLIKRITQIQERGYLVAGDNRADSLKIDLVAKDKVIAKIFNF